MGEPERKPLKLAGPSGVLCCGPHRLHRPSLPRSRRAERPAQRAPHVRVSLAEVMQWVNWKAASAAAASGTSPGPRGQGNRKFQIVPCRDGHVAVVLHRDAVAGGAGVDRRRAAKRSEIRPRAPARRKHNRRALRHHHAVVRGQGRAPRSNTPAQSKGRTVSAPSSLRPELLLTEQYVTRSFLAEMKHPALGRFLMPQLPVQWNGRSLRAHEPAPEIARSELRRHDSSPRRRARARFRAC